MQFFIPEISTQIKLTESWIFRLYTEYRNNSIFEALGDNVKNLKEIEIPSLKNNFYTFHQKCYEMFLQIGTVLTIKRVYVRQGQKDYSSVTFNLNDTTHPFLIRHKLKNKKKICGTFWVKLCDANNIQCEVIKDTSLKYEEEASGNNENQSI
jgi:hypothetical protein